MRGMWISLGKKIQGRRNSAIALSRSLPGLTQEAAWARCVAGGELARGAVVQHTEAVISGLDLVWHYENPGQRSRACCSKRTGFLRKDRLMPL